ncbi:hypothetical protein [Motiliproteus sediminis]|uniref:hypothetical protein n=1 Tax=Motiliproteus sediminis TaxID=1468178 RepID=UPI001AEFFB30|nr:hypothetical protein [Motiliproteus sediminis]
MRTRRHRGFTKFELVICILVIVVVATALYSRYMALVADAERAAFRGVMGWLQAGVNVRMSLALSDGDLSELQQLEGSNPMALVAEVMSLPSNYLGVLDDEAAARARPGNWYFDRDRGLLVYRFRYQSTAEGFTRAADERLGFRLKVNYRPAANQGRAAVSGLVLQAVGPDQWQLADSQGLR